MLREALAVGLAGFSRRVLAADLHDSAALQEALLLHPDLVVCGPERRAGAGLIVPGGLSVVQMRPTATSDLVGVLVRGAVPAPLSMAALDEVACDALVHAPALRARLAARARARAGL